MIRVVYSWFIVLAFSTQIVSQTQIVRGTIVDLDSQIPLIGATIQHLSEDPIGTTTDIDGTFKLDDIPTGRQSFLIQYLGYELQRIDELLITTSKEVVLNIKLKESVTQLSEVTIQAKSQGHEALNEMSMISARSMSIEELNRHPANFNDPAKMALGFLGVSFAGNDETNEIVVRGNSPAGVLWRIEGIEVSNPNHFSEAGTAGGGISMLSTNAMGVSDFFAGAFPAEFGNASSGVFDIKLRNGNNHTTEATAQIGFLGLSGALEGPIKKGYGGSYLINYRYSTLGIMKRLGVLGSGIGSPDFQDLSFKVRLPTKGFGTFNLFGLGGSFISEDEYTRRSIPRIDETTGSTTIVGLSHLLALSNKTYLKTVAATNYAGRFYNTGRLDVPIEGEFDSDYKESFEDKSTRISFLLNHKFSRKYVLRAGAIYSFLNYNLKLEDRFSFFRETPEGLIVEDYTDDWIVPLDSKGNSYSIQSYLQLKYNISNNLTLNTGVHVLHLGLNKNTSVEPRAGIKWQFSPRESLALGFGRHSQIESLPTYFVQRENVQGEMFFPNEQLPLQNSTHYILSYNRALTEKLNLKVETYYQNINNLPISSSPNSNIALLNENYFDVFFDIPSLVGSGKGRNYGIDVSLEKSFNKNSYLVLNGSLFQSEYQTSTNVWHPTRYNSNYNFVAIAGREFQFGKNANKTIGLNIKILMNGAQRYTPINVQASFLAKEEVFEDPPFRRHLPAYFRIDTGINYSRSKNRVLHVISLNVQNLTNRENIFSQIQFYSQLRDEVIQRQSAQLPLIPILSYRIEF